MPEDIRKKLANLVTALSVYAQPPATEPTKRPTNDKPSAQPATAKPEPDRVYTR